MKDTLKRLESQGLIERISAGSKQVVPNLRRAEKDLLTAKATIDVDEEWAYTIAYHAMLRSGRALMLSLGYRPTHLRTGTADSKDGSREVPGKRGTIREGDCVENPPIGSPG
jgi:predicted transcriptional regulator of viral defense system